MNRNHRILVLVLIAMALVISPLRGVFAMPVMPAEDNNSHCAQMQDHGSSQSQVADLEPATEDAGHDCAQGCAGDCCDGACNTCVHSAVAITGFTTCNAAVQVDPLKLDITRDFTGQFVHPPFRPPISLHS